MKIISWNVNGLRACVNKGFLDFFDNSDADIFCVQETKVQAGQIAIIRENYLQYWNYAEKKGYSGTAVFSKHEPLKRQNGIGIEKHDLEGRVITLEFEDFFMVNVYTPNARPELARIDYRMEWEDAFRDYLMNLDAQKPVIVCGDMNVAHEEIDLKNPKSNKGNAGFSDEERGKLDELLNSGFTDTFRHFHPDTANAYSWWSYRFNARAHNSGWRIDYFLVSDRLTEKLSDSKILSDVMGSDHCPVELDINI